MQTSVGWDWPGIGLEVANMSSVQDNPSQPGGVAPLELEISGEIFTLINCQTYTDFCQKNKRSRKNPV